jgi:PPK2 family polyphosphate:nucleotide phosphotransferase
MPELDPKRIADFIRPFRVEPGRKVRLSKDFTTDFSAEGATKAEAKAILQEGIELLAEYQARLAAQDTYGLLVILQAMDAAGKDGTIRHVMSGVNPQGVSVHSFKVPSTEELDHDYLWRYALQLPARGMIGIFNRSYYEEVLVVRVHPQILAAQKLPAASKRGDVWARRFREINDWERYLVDNGIRIVKLFLNVSREEQRRRFLARIDLPEKNWKFSASDAKERAYWDDYQRAFDEVLSETSTASAPWYVIPADTKAFARLIAAGVIADALIDIDPHYPELDPAARAGLQEARVALEAEVAEGARAAGDRETAQGPDKAARRAAKRAAKTEHRAAKEAAKAERRTAKAAAKAAAKTERRAAKEAAKAERRTAKAAAEGGASAGPVVEHDAGILDEPVGTATQGEVAEAEPEAAPEPEAVAPPNAEPEPAPEPETVAPPEAAPEPQVVAPPEPASGQIAQGAGDVVDEDAPLEWVRGQESPSPAVDPNEEPGPGEPTGVG